jgi:transposase
MALNTEKHEELRKNGSFNHRAHAVAAEVFTSSSFFDKHDLMQVKYEMLRSVEKERIDVSSASEAFGFSRVSFYQIKREFDEHGVTGLMPKKRGPKGPRKLNQSDIEFAKSLTGTHTKTQIVMCLREERGVEVSKRTLERQLSIKKNSGPF